MNDRQTNNSNSIVNDLAALGLFLVFGAVSGLLFALLVTRTNLQEFFFIKGDKFLIPRHAYWFAFSLLQLLGLSGAYTVCFWRHWIAQPISSGRLLSGALIIGLATPVLSLVTPVMNSRLGLDWDFMVAPIIFVFLLSCALCISSAQLRKLPMVVIWILLFVAAGVGFVYLIVRLIGRTDSYEFVQWPILEAMFALSFGSWLIWQQRVKSNRAIQHALAADSPVSRLYL